MFTDHQKIPVMLASLGVLVISGLILWGLTGSSPEDPAFRSAYSEVIVGMSEGEAISLLGKPDDRGEEFYLAQREGFEDAYMRAKFSRAQQYLFWNRDSDRVYVVGVDGSGQVVLLEKGGNI